MCNSKSKKRAHKHRRDRALSHRLRTQHRLNDLADEMLAKTVASSASPPSSSSLARCGLCVVDESSGVCIYTNIHSRTHTFARAHTRRSTPIRLRFHCVRAWFRVRVCFCSRRVFVVLLRLQSNTFCTQPGDEKATGSYVWYGCERAIVEKNYNVLCSRRRRTRVQRVASISLAM